jgi:drug/metabolite transporter superfamily protein YnfA
MCFFSSPCAQSYQSISEYKELFFMLDSEGAGRAGATFGELYMNQAMLWDEGSEYGRYVE